MSRARPKIATAAWHLLPDSLRRKLRGETGKRFFRFVIVAVSALAASQLALFLFLGPAGLSGGISGVAAAAVGALVSYLLSRWAWERKGRPSLLKETLPFWLVSIGAWIVLGVASHYASVWAVSMNLGHWQRVAVVNGVYFVANCVTFVTRFAIFHYVLFADRASKTAPPPLAGSAGLAAALEADLADDEDLAAPVNGQGVGGGHEDLADVKGTAPAAAKGPTGVASGRPATR